MKKVFIHAFGLAFVIVSFAASASYAGEYKSASEIPGAYVIAKSNPCNPCNPCGGIKNPCGVKNPCSAAPDIKPIRSKHTKDYSKLIAMGKKLWNNDSLGKSGLSCMSCHDDHQDLYPEKGLSWPRYVNMPQDILTLDQMINFCMINPMEGKQLNPNSIKMTAMAAYYMHYMKSSKSMGKGQPMNPCGVEMPGRGEMQNPCSAEMPGKGKMRNPCGR